MAKRLSNLSFHTLVFSQRFSKGSRTERVQISGATPRAKDAALCKDLLNKQCVLTKVGTVFSF